MKSYKIKHEDEHLVHIEHPDGSIFAVAKRAVGKDTLNRIKQFCAGGEVQKFAGGGEVDGGIIDAITPHGAGKGIMDNLGAVVGSPAYRQELADNVASYANPILDAITPHGAGKGIMESLQSLVGSPAKADELVPAAPVVVNAQGIPASIAAPALADSSPAPAAQAIPVATPAAAPALPGVGGMGSAFKGMENAYKDYSAATQTALEANRKAEEKVYADQQANSAAFEAEHGRLTQKYMDQKIDPDRIWHNQSTGQKIGSAIALALGGIGAGLTHGPNQALEVMNKAMDADIESQKSDRDNTKTLLQLNLDKYKNKETALTATRLMNTARLDGELKGAMGKATTAQGLAQIQMMRAQNAQNQQALGAQLAQQQLANKVVRGEQITPAAAEYLPEKMRTRAVTVTGENGQPKLALARTPELAKEYSEARMHSQDMDKKIVDAIKFMKERGYSPNPWGEDRGVADSIRGSILTSMGKLHDLNRLNEQEFTQYQKMVPDPGQMRTDAGIAQLMQLRKLVRDKDQSAAANLLENYNPGQFTSMMGAPVRK